MRDSRAERGFQAGFRTAGFAGGVPLQEVLVTGINSGHPTPWTCSVDTVVKPSWNDFLAESPLLTHTLSAPNFAVIFFSFSIEIKLSMVCFCLPESSTSFSSSFAFTRSNCVARYRRKSRKSPLRYVQDINGSVRS